MSSMTGCYLSPSLASAVPHMLSVQVHGMLGSSSHYQVLFRAPCCVFSILAVEISFLPFFLTFPPLASYLLFPGVCLLNLSLFFKDQTKPHSSSKAFTHLLPILTHQPPH